MNLSIRLIGRMKPQKTKGPKSQKKIKIIIIIIIIIITATWNLPQLLLLLRAGLYSVLSIIVHQIRIPRPPQSSGLETINDRVTNLHGLAVCVPLPSGLLVGRQRCATFAEYYALPAFSSPLPLLPPPPSPPLPIGFTILLRDIRRPLDDLILPCLRGVRQLFGACSVLEILASIGPKSAIDLRLGAQTLEHSRPSSSLREFSTISPPSTTQFRVPPVASNLSCESTLHLPRYGLGAWSRRIT
jgi:hypothetical protein